MIDIPVSWGELVDKITILEIKAAKLTDPQKLANVERELSLLRARLGDALPDGGELQRRLKGVNSDLWVIEDEIRDCERQGDFGPTFIELARLVYRTNDRRAELKRAINLQLGSGIVEEKSYAAY